MLLVLLHKNRVIFFTIVNRTQVIIGHIRTRKFLVFNMGSNPPHFPKGGKIEVHHIIRKVQKSDPFLVCGRKKFNHSFLPTFLQHDGLTILFISILIDKDHSYLQILILGSIEHCINILKYINSRQFLRLNGTSSH